MAKWSNGICKWPNNKMALAKKPKNPIWTFNK